MSAVFQIGLRAVVAGAAGEAVPAASLHAGLAGGTVRPALLRLALGAALRRLLTDVSHVVVVEPVFLSAPARAAISAAFAGLGVSTSYLLEPLCAAVDAALPLILYIDVGWSGVTVVPVCEHRVVVGGVRSSSRGESGRGTVPAVEYYVDAPASDTDDESVVAVACAAVAACAVDTRAVLLSHVVFGGLGLMSPGLCAEVLQRIRSVSSTPVAAVVASAWRGASAYVSVHGHGGSRDWVDVVYRGGE